jgi:hypothetical protein
MSWGLKNAEDTELIDAWEKSIVRLLMEILCRFTAPVVIVVHSRGDRSARGFAVTPQVVAFGVEDRLHHLPASAACFAVRSAASAMRRHSVCTVLSPAWSTPGETRQHARGRRLLHKIRALRGDGKRQNGCPTNGERRSYEPQRTPTTFR